SAPRDSFHVPRGLRTSSSAYRVLAPGRGVPPRPPHGARGGAAVSRHCHHRSRGVVWRHWLLPGGGQGGGGAGHRRRGVRRAAELRFPAMGSPDHGVLYGAIDFYQAAVKAGVKPIIGCEVYVAPGSRFEKRTSGGGRDVYHHLVLLAKDLQGYRNLVRLVTA